MAELVALWVRIQTAQKYEMGDISTGVANTLYNDKKENQIFSYIRKFRVEQLQIHKGFLIYEEMRRYFPIYEEAVSHIGMTLHCLQLLHSEFPYIWGKFDYLFYQCSPPKDIRNCYRK